MRSLCPLTLTVFLATSVGTVRADGLIHRLPEDGSWVRFHVELNRRLGAREVTTKGSVTMSSVGRVTLDGEKYRWIEFRSEFREWYFKDVYKLLIPERYLKQGEEPLQHVLKAWRRVGWYLESQELKVLEEGFGTVFSNLITFLHDPSREVKKLGKEVVESKLGKLACEGVTGQTKPAPPRGGQGVWHGTYLTRLHPKAPFGVVSARVEYELKRGGQVQRSRSLTLKLADAGTSAVSALPDKHLEVGDKLVGPMVGHVTPTTALLWASARQKGEIKVRYRSEGSPETMSHTVFVVPSEADHYAGKAKLTGLEPSTTYAYTLELDGEVDKLRPGSFTTPPPYGTPSRFKVAVSSCMLADHPNQSSWYLLLAERPAFHLLLGDNVYADTTDREKLWTKHLEQRRVEEFAAVCRTVPTYAIWDDHDYATGNSDGTAPGKAESLRAFRELFVNPGYGTEGTPGVFYRFSWGDVDFFMLDGRYYRSPNAAPNDEKKRMLGDEQFRWLVKGLMSSRAKFKVLASGSTLGLKWRDTWRLYDFSRKRLFRTIMENRITGVFFLSGDLHRCTFETHPAKETGGYPIYEVISSGIAASPTRGFAVLEFDTARPDPAVRIRIIHGDATTQFDRTLKLSQLQVPGS